jgi:hypothetical protein
MTTITTARPRTPLIATLAAGAALVVGGAMGVAWEQNHHDTPSATSQSQTTTPDSFGGATTSEEMSGSVPANRSAGGATTSDEFSGSTSGSIPATGSPGGATSGQESTQ